MRRAPESGVERLRAALRKAAQDVAYVAHRHGDPVVRARFGRLFDEVDGLLAEVGGVEDSALDDALSLLWVGAVERWLAWFGPRLRSTVSPAGPVGAPPPPGEEPN